MAKLFSPPKLPATPEFQAAPETAAAPAETKPAATSPAATATPATPAAPAEQPTATTTTPDAAKTLELNLARRERGRTGTVLTSWRGVLEPGALAPVRKNLLGE
jgi:hypothetical protein